MEKCFYCPEPATTKDHIVPLSRGGKNTLSNKVPCCKLCNSTKGNIPQEDYIKFMKYVMQEIYSLRVVNKRKRRLLKLQFFKDTGIKIGVTEL